MKVFGDILSFHTIQNTRYEAELNPDLSLSSTFCAFLFLMTVSEGNTSITGSDNT